MGRQHRRRGLGTRVADRHQARRALYLGCAGSWEYADLHEIIPLHVAALDDEAHIGLIGDAHCPGASPGGFRRQPVALPVKRTCSPRSLVV